MYWDSGQASKYVSDQPCYRLYTQALNFFDAFRLFKYQPGGGTPLLDKARSEFASSAVKVLRIVILFGFQPVTESMEVVPGFDQYFIEDKQKFSFT